MRNQRLGCFTPAGIIAAAVMVLLILGTGMVKGGALFSPGGLNATTGSPLGGVTSHAAIDGRCETCHTAPWDRTSMSDRCLACHTQIQADIANPKTIHGGLIHTDREANCLNCHTEHHGVQALLTRVDIANFPHDVTGFSLKSHVKMADNQPFQCKNCHVQEFSRVDNPVCTNCHVKTDKPFMTNHMAAFGQKCLNCHDGQESLGKTFDHRQVRFALTGKHAQIDCQKCHQNQTTLKELQATPLGCAACHQKDDAHQGLMGPDCAKCHATDTWKTSSFDHTKNTNFPLIGKHLVLQCQKCHTNQDLKVTPKECIACHKQDDAHKGLLGVNCAACHTPTAWKPANFNHNKNTKFELTGKHIALQCQQCHATSDLKNTPVDCAGCHQKDDAHHSTLGTDCAACHSTSGWKSVSFDHNTRNTFDLVGKHVGVQCQSCHTQPNPKNTPANCAACHSKSDIHQGQLGANCAACHSPSGWKPSTFNHAQAPFKLTGMHLQADCSACHQDKVFKNTPTACISCHQKNDAHHGTMGSDCSLCHSTSAWKPSTFDHNRSAFQLTGAHVSVQCAACHVNGIFKGLSMSCAACHSKDDHHNGQFGKDCAACHTTSSWKNVTFNHAKSAFPLTGAHQNAACAQCHENGAFKGTPTNCYACHAKNDNHQGKFGTDCGACHNTSNWQNATFDHARSGFPLTGAHVNVTCQKCHANGFSGTPTACSACHGEPQFHAGLLGSNCAACHNTSAWRPAKFNGVHSFPMGHGGANSCRSCHTSTLAAYTCYTCHNQNEIVKKHQEKNITDLSNCVRCHANGKGD